VIRRQRWIASLIRASPATTETTKSTRTATRQQQQQQQTILPSEILLGSVIHGDRFQDCRDLQHSSDKRKKTKDNRQEITKDKRQKTRNNKRQLTRDKNCFKKKKHQKNKNTVLHLARN